MTSAAGTLATWRDVRVKSAFEGKAEVGASVASLQSREEASVLLLLSEEGDDLFSIIA
jgi:hypothetical protein